MIPILLAVNFHYVGMKGLPFPGLHSLDESELKIILEDLGKTFDFVKSDTLVKLIDKNQKISSPLCAITFDDGLSCQYTSALPVLENMKIPATFFVPGLPYLESKVCTIHKLHWLRAHMSQTELHKNLLNKYTSMIGKEVDIEGISDIEVLSVLPNDDLEIGKLKYWLHYIINENENELIVDSLFKDIVDSEKEFVESFYMSKSMLKKLNAMAGHRVGAHGYTHRPLATLSDADVINEVNKTKDALSAAIGDSIDAFSYPHGSYSAVNQRNSEIVLNAGFKYAFTMERGFNSTLQQPGLLARIDCIETSVGKCALYEYTCDLPVSLNDNYPVFRERYLDEPDIPVT